MEKIENYLQEKLKWRLLLKLDKEKNPPATIKEKIEFLDKRLNFIYKNDVYCENPFSPLFFLNDGRRTADISDLKDEDIIQIKSIIKHTDDPILKGKLYDVLWVLTKEKEYAQHSALSYFDYVTNNLSDSLSNVVFPLQRCLFLLDFIKEETLLNEKISCLMNHSHFPNSKQKKIVFFYIADFLAGFKKKLLKDYIYNLESLFEESIEEDNMDLGIIEILLNHYRSCHNTTQIERFGNLYADICEKIYENKKPYGYEFFDKAISLLTEDVFDERVNSLMLKREEAHHRLSERFKGNAIPLPMEELNFAIDEKRKEIIKVFQENDGLTQFCFLLNNFKAPIINDIEQTLAKNKESNMLIDLCNNIVFDEEKNIIFESAKASSLEKKELEIANYYKLRYQVSFALMLHPFLQNIKIDDGLSALIDDIVKHNLFVPKDRQENVKENIFKIMHGQIREGLDGILVQFEHGCRMFLKNYKKLYPQRKKGSKYDGLSFEDMFVCKGKETKFRKAICEILGNDLTLAIEYLSCRKLSGNIRNKYYHYGYGNKDEYTKEEVYLSFLLILAYCKGFES